MEGLKLYLRNTEAAERGFEEVHVVDRTDGVETRKIFQGRQLARLSQSLEGKRVECTSYLTPKENIAVVRSEHPDFVAVARGAGAAGRMLAVALRLLGIPTPPRGLPVPIPLGAHATRKKSPMMCSISPAAL